MAMGAKDMQLELQALQRLYGLLKTDGDAISNRTSDVLDGHARLLLKKLLDAATQRTLEAHAEWISGRVEASRKVSPTLLKQPFPQSEFGLTAAAYSKSCGVDQASMEQEPVFHVGTTSGSEYRKKRCRVCKSTVNEQLASIEQSKLYDDVPQNSNKPINLQQKEQSERFLLSSEPEIGSPSISTTVNSNSEKGMQMVHNSDFEPEIAERNSKVPKEGSEKAVQEIELCISALHLLEQCSAQPQNFAAPGTVLRVELNKNAESFTDRINMPCKFTSQSIQEPEDHEPRQKKMNFPLLYSSLPLGPGQPNNSVLQLSTCQFIRSRGQDLGYMSDEQQLSDQKMGQIRGQNVKAFIDRIESGKWRTTNDNILAHDQNEISNSTENLITNGNILNAGPNVNSTWEARKQRSKRTEETLPKSRPALHKDGISKNKKYESATKTALRQQESESASSSSSYGGNNSDSEVYSSPDQSRSSYTSPLSNGTPSQCSSFSNSSEDEVYSSTSSDGAREVTSSSSRKSDRYYSSDDQPIHCQSRPNYKSTSRGAGPSRIWKSGYNNTDRKTKTTGTWRRLKDRLGIIFHHHHHHHNRNDDQAKMKHNGKQPFLSKREAEAYGEKAVEKMMKSKARDKNHHTFHGLMGAVLRHVRDSKKSRSAEKIGSALNKRHAGNKTGSKKPHWLKLLQHHRKAELANKKHEKQRKPHLKALPTMKV